MKKVKIAILPLIDVQRDSYWMLPGYMDGILNAGGYPVMLPLDVNEKNLRQVAEEYDGFLFPGGQDVAPKRYGERPMAVCGEVCEKLDWMSMLLFEQILERDRPLLGICRGLQCINVLLGGTLYQDIPTQYPGRVNHHMTPPYDRTVHKVVIEPGTPLYEMLGVTTLEVNSYHHQAVKALSRRLKAMAISEDGLVEAAYMPDKSFVMAFQWHPEFAFRTDQNSRLIFESFVKACKK